MDSSSSKSHDGRFQDQVYFTFGASFQISPFVLDLACFQVSVTFID
eukprot:gene11440-15327_t